MQCSIYGGLLAAGLATAISMDTNSSSSSEERPATGSGLAYAESCQSQLFAWSSSETSFGSEYGHASTSIFSTEMSVVSYEPVSPTVTSSVTLCDGHARQVGQWTTRNGSSTTFNTEWTNSNSIFVPAPYPTPKPCSIDPDDCQLLYSSWTSHWNSITLNSPDYTEGLLDPPCDTSTRPQPTYSTNAGGKQCDNCLIAGNEIRLLYWPVTTIAGSGNLCNKTAETFTGTETGAPRSVVTKGITIISPTIAISIGGLSRVDDCGITVPHTIIPVLPEDVTSVEGARALFTHKPFNFADLNYKCLDAPDEDFVTTGTRTDCYREVPASAYFLGFQNAAGANWYDSNAFANRTIYDNYQPQVLPPATITSAIRSLWGPDCYIHPNGIWDPPIALQQESSFPLPKAGPAAPTQYYTPHTDAPQPGGPTTPHAPGPTRPVNEGRPTAEAQLHPSAPRPEPQSGGSSEEHGGPHSPDDGSAPENSGHSGDDGEHDAGNASHYSGHGGQSPANGDQNPGSEGQDLGNEGQDLNHGGHGSGNDGDGASMPTATQESSAGPGNDDEDASPSGLESQPSSNDDAGLSGTRHQSTIASTTVLYEHASDDNGSTATETGRQSSTQSTGVAGSDSGPSAVSSDRADDGAVSSAIQSGMGGGDRSQDTSSQVNAAISVSKTIGKRLARLAMAVSVLL